MGKKTIIITERDGEVLKRLARYGLLNRRHVQRLCFPVGDIGARIARRRLASLAEAGLIRRHSMVVASGFDSAPAPVYLLAERGREWLANEMADDSLLLKPVKPPHPLHLFHHLAVSEFHILLDAAIATNKKFTVESWFNEADIVNTDEPDPRRHFRLFTVMGKQPCKVCAPDAGFLLGCHGRREAFYVEVERGTGSRGTGVRQLGDRKCPGCAEAARQRLHRKHFPSATADDFTVLLIAPSRQRRDAIRRAFRERDPIADRPDVWRFCSQADLTPETFLVGNVWFGCDDLPPTPLVGG